jgi:hypothetical protein
VRSEVGGTGIGESFQPSESETYTHNSLFIQEKVTITLERV